MITGSGDREPSAPSRGTPRSCRRRSAKSGETLISQPARSIALAVAGEHRRRQQPLTHRVVGQLRARAAGSTCSRASACARARARASASSCATIPPIEMPMTCARSSPSASSSADGVVGQVGDRERPAQRRASARRRGGRRRSARSRARARRGTARPSAGACRSCPGSAAAARRRRGARSAGRCRRRRERRHRPSSATSGSASWSAAARARLARRLERRDTRTPSSRTGRAGAYSRSSSSATARRPSRRRSSRAAIVRARVTVVQSSSRTLIAIVRPRRSCAAGRSQSCAASSREDRLQPRRVGDVVVERRLARLD